MGTFMNSLLFCVCTSLSLPVFLCVSVCLTVCLCLRDQRFETEQTIRTRPEVRTSFALLAGISDLPFSELGAGISG